jgi:hypothetical protein
MVSGTVARALAYMDAHLFGAKSTPTVALPRAYPEDVPLSASATDTGRAICG